MQQEVLDVLGGSRNLEDRAKAWKVYRRYMDELVDADVKELAIPRRVSKLTIPGDVSRLRLCRLILSRVFL